MPRALLSVADKTGIVDLARGLAARDFELVSTGGTARERVDDRTAMARHGIQPIDVVVVNLYPFARAAASSTTPFDALIEEIDIGGPSLVRAAAKNFKDVLIVVDSGDYSRLLTALDE